MRKDGRMKLKFGLPSASLFPLPLSRVLKKASQAGFDFVEVLLLGTWTRETVEYFKSLADPLHLDLHFHQAWTTQGSPKAMQLRNTLLTVIGYLPPDGHCPSDWIPDNARPLVAYAERIREFIGWDRVWFQSISQQRALTDRTLLLPCTDFTQEVEEKNLSVVFDTVHFIEYMRGESGIEGIALTKSQLFAAWKGFWDRVGSQVREIHFNDFNPSLGALRGCNLWPGTGVAPLQDFAAMVKTNGWDGCVVPEVQPRLPFPYGAKELLDLRNTTEAYFSKVP